MTTSTVTLTIVFFIFSSLRPLSGDPCDPKTLPDPKTLRSDQITVLINGYSESRLHLLIKIAAAYASSPSVAAVLILWSNPTTSPQTLTHLHRNLSAAAIGGGAPISLHRHPTTSLNSRFLPRRQISTRAVAICDDDVEIDANSFEFAFKIWSSRQKNLIGFFARSHDLDLEKKRWIYTVHPDKYSILLTKLMILHVDYLFIYTCNETLTQLRELVDEMRNCEDILMNFVVADESGSGPVLVGSERLRDRGDSRNAGEFEGVKEVGLSSRRGEHRKRRGECVNEFHRRLGRMPLRYSYGKVVNSVGEQGLCLKGGKLVFCDEQVF